MAIAEPEIARRLPNAVEVTAQPVRLRFRLDNLRCADSHLARILFSCSMKVLEQPIERKAFVETFLTTRSVVTADDLVQHFHPALLRAASKFTEQHRAEALVDKTTPDDLIAALRKAADPLEFDSGLQLLPPFELTIHSDTLERERFDHNQRKIAERRAADQIQHVQRAADLFKRFQDLQSAAPQLSPGAILQRLTETDRLDMYEALLLTRNTSHTRPLWAVTGNELLKIDLRSAAPAVDQKIFPAGPFRSVSITDSDTGPLALLGARDQIIIYDPTTGSHTSRIVEGAATPPPQLGFNSAILHQAALFATHGELGIRAWNPDGSPRAVLALEHLPTPTFHRSSSRVGGSIQTIASVAHPAQLAGPRNLIALDSRLLFSIGNLIATLDPETLNLVILNPNDIQADVLALFATRDRLLVIYDNGIIHLRDRNTLDLIRELPRPGNLSAAAPYPWLGETRLLLAHDDGCIDCIGLDDTIVTEYRSAYRDIKDIAATDTIIAAVAANRTKILFWHPHDGAKPFAELHVASLTRHRVADIAFA